jgi:hypothetical protein
MELLSGCYEHEYFIVSVTDGIVKLLPFVIKRSAVKAYEIVEVRLHAFLILALNGHE